MPPWSRFRRWVQPFAPDPVPAVTVPAIPAEEWPPVDAPEPEQFSGRWADMP